MLCSIRQNEMGDENPPNIIIYDDQKSRMFELVFQNNVGRGAYVKVKTFFVSGNPTINLADAFNKAMNLLEMSGVAGVQAYYKPDTVANSTQYRQFVVMMLVAGAESKPANNDLMRLTLRL